MAASELRITEVGANGEALSCAICYSGLVSVLRSTSSFELSDYEHALFGMPGARRLRVTLDGRQFRNQDAVYIGVGERFSVSDVSVREFLQRAGFTRAEGSKLLKRLGLEALLRQKLSDFERPIVDVLRVVAACKERSAILVIAEPFKALAPSAREALAEWIMQAADQHDLIVIVTRLSERPDVWVDSINVARVSLDDASPIDGTVGPAGANAATQAVLNRLRARVRADDAKGNAEVDARAQERSRRFVWAAFSSSVFLACVLGIVVFRAQHFAVQEEVQVEIPERAATRPHHLPGEGRRAAGIDPQNAKPSGQAQLFAYGNHERLVLSLYPQQIQESIGAAFRMEKREAPAGVAPVEESGGAQELLQFLAAASQTEGGTAGASPGVYQPAIAPPPDLSGAEFQPPMIVSPEPAFSDQEWEQRREEMRRRFLEAVMANSQQ